MDLDWPSPKKIVPSITLKSCIQGLNYIEISFRHEFQQILIRNIPSQLRFCLYIELIMSIYIIHVIAICISTYIFIHIFFSYIHTYVLE